MRLGQNCQRQRHLRSTPTDAEHRLWQCLRDRRLGGFKFRRQQAVGPYFADFCCLGARLVVEVDGGQHGDALDYDQRRARYFAQADLRVLRFWNDDVLARTDVVLDAILLALVVDRDQQGVAPAR